MTSYFSNTNDTKILQIITVWREGNIDLSSIGFRKALGGGEMLYEKFKLTKRLLSKIGSFFGTVFAWLLALILGICVLFALPIDYIKYKQSYYYKTEGRKYSLFAAAGMHFEMYNLIVKNNLPIKYVKNPENDNLDSGWFVFGETLLIIDDYGFEYDENNGVWMHTAYIYDEDENEKVIKTPLGEYFKTEIEETNELAGETICTKAVVLLDGTIFDNAPLAKSEESFLVYDDLLEGLKAFCEKEI